MREIKFRAWDKIGKKFVSAESVSDQKIPVIPTEHGFVLKTKFILSQFTGMKDKDGKEVYEGDVVEAAWMHHGKPGQVFMAFIFFNEHIGSFRIGYESLGGFSQDEVYFRYQVKVIGNVYENPDLVPLPGKDYQPKSLVT